MRKEDNYPYTETTVICDNGAKVIVRRPILPPDERERRENRIRQAVIRLYDHCRENHIPWPSDPEYDAYVAEQERLEAERRKAARPKKSKKSSVV